MKKFGIVVLVLLMLFAFANCGQEQKIETGTYTLEGNADISIEIQNFKDIKFNGMDVYFDAITEDWNADRAAKNAEREQAGKKKLEEVDVAANITGQFDTNKEGTRIYVRVKEAMEDKLQLSVQFVYSKENKTIQLCLSEIGLEDLTFVLQQP